MKTLKRKMTAGAARLLYIGLGLILTASFAFATGGGESQAAEKPVKLVGYLLGEAPPGMPAVMDALNKKFQADINATMEINYIGWGDFQSKYPLILAAGQDLDWIYTANWAFYFQQAAKGAFYEITESLLQKNMPRHYAALSKDAYKEMKVNGKYYMIPTASPDRKVPVTLIRGDLRKKYGIAPITKLSQIESYLAAIKANEKEMFPMYMDNSYDIGTPFGHLYNELGPSYIDILFATGGGTGIVWELEDPTGTLKLMFEDSTIVANLKKAAATMKTWYDKGFINQDVFANKVRSKDSFNLGRSAVAFGNSQDTQANIADAVAKGWEPEIIPNLNASGHYPADPYINNGVAVAAGSKNPERTLQALDLILEEKSYNYLVYFGIEGVNYVVKDNKIDLPPGLTPDKNTYAPDAAGFWFTNKDQFLPLATWPAAYVQLKNDMLQKGYLKSTLFATCPIVTDSVKTEVATLNQVMVQYFQPLGIGAVDDIDKAITNLKDKTRAAGIVKVQSDLQAQVTAYFNANK